MLRFLYITDTHIGCSNDGYHLQPRYVGCEERLFAGLAQWVAEHDIHFVVHGGDLTDHGTPEAETAWCIGPLATIEIRYAED